jgi:8-oxo-dGTP pyrophosphatase MutT (NUDIX family)
MIPLMAAPPLSKVQVIVYCRTPEIRILLLQRPEDRGHVWQPVTGNMEPQDGHYVHAARRELEEETGISDVLHLVETGLEFHFQKDGRPVREYLVGAEVARFHAVRLSEEHVAFAWLSPSEAEARLTWDIHREGIQAVLLAVK